MSLLDGIIDPDVHLPAENVPGPDRCVDCGVMRKLGESAWLWPEGKERLVVCAKHRAERQRSAGLLRMRPSREHVDVRDLVMRKERR